jgi:hypothetical protein
MSPTRGHSSDDGGRGDVLRIQHHPVEIQQANQSRYVMATRDDEKLFRREIRLQTLGVALAHGLVRVLYEGRYGEDVSFLT